MCPWSASDAKRFSKKASGNKNTSQQWADVANSVLAKTGDDATAVKQANGVIAKAKTKSTAPQNHIPKVGNNGKL